MYSLAGAFEMGDPFVFIPKEFNTCVGGGAWSKR